MGENVTRRGFVGVGAKATAAIAVLATPSIAEANTTKKHRPVKKKPVKKKTKPVSCTPAAPPVATAPAGGRIDLHAHHIPPVYRAALLEAGQLTIGGYPTPPWSPQEAIAFMDNYGIGTQVLSLSDPGVSFLSGTAAQNLARQVNEYTASLIQQYPGRFGGFAVLPMPDIQASLTELEYALDVLGLDGVGLLSSYNGQNLGSATYNVLWEEINRRNAFVFLHPTTLPSDMKPPSVLPDFLVEFTFETTRFCATALDEGLFSLFPNLRIQLAHSGGCYPFLAYRVAAVGKGVTAFLEPSSTSPLGVFPTSQTQGLFYDTALSPAPSSARSILEISDIDHVIFGSDWPFTQLLFLRSGDPQPELSLTFDQQERHAIERANALALLPSLAKRLG